MLFRLLLAGALALGLSAVPALSPAENRAVARERIVRVQPDATTLSLERTRVIRLDRAADSVVAYWRGHPHARVTLELSYDGRSFGPPVPAGRDEIGDERGDGRTYGALRSAAGAVAVRVTSDRRIARLTLLALSDTHGATRRTVAPTQAPELLPAAAAATGQPAVVARAGWGADPTLMTWAPTFHATRKLVVHHTDTSNEYSDRAGAESQIRAIYYYHSVTQGWGDIGYNFLIDKFGTVYEGRYSREYAGTDPTGDDAAGRGVTGAHTGGWNSGTVGAALLGTMTGADATPAARDALERLLAWEAARHGIDPQASETFVNPVSGSSITTPNIAGHRDYSATACPGDAFHPTLPELRRAVAARIAGSAPAPEPQPEAPDTTAPTSPTGLTATAGRTSVRLTWQPAHDDRAVARYQVWRSRSATTGFAQVGTTTGTTFGNGALRRATRYWYRVRAVDTSGNLGRFGATVSARTR